MPETITVDVCVDCQIPLLTLANNVRQGNPDGLAAVWSPKGGCTCAGVTEADADPTCGVCFPAVRRCRSCGDAAGVGGRNV